MLYHFVNHTLCLQSNQNSQVTSNAHPKPIQAAPNISDMQIDSKLRGLQSGDGKGSYEDREQSSNDQGLRFSSEYSYEQEYQESEERGCTAV